MDFLTENYQRILLAALLGAVIGGEREWSGKSAGFRTMMLVCIGSALFTIVSYDMAIIDTKHNSDVTRIASNILTGIGFIGAGLIFKGEQSVQGLTTAATVWSAAAIGMAVGIGDYKLAISTTVLVWLILVILHKLEEKIELLHVTRKYKIRYNIPAGGELPELTDVFPDKRYKITDKKIEKANNQIVCSWTIRAPQKYHDAAIHKLLRDDNISSLDY